MKSPAALIDNCAGLTPKGSHSLLDSISLMNVLAALKAPWHLEVIDGGDHSFNVPKSTGLMSDEVFRNILGSILR